MAKKSQQRKLDPLAVETGRRLRKERKARNWRQPELANLCKPKGPGTTAISNFEVGSRRIKYEYALVFEKVFGRPAAYFMGLISEQEADVIAAMRKNVESKT